MAFDQMELLGLNALEKRMKILWGLAIIAIIVLFPLLFFFFSKKIIFFNRYKVDQVKEVQSPNRSHKSYQVYAIRMGLRKNIFFEQNQFSREMLRVYYCDKFEFNCTLMKFDDLILEFNKDIISLEIYSDSFNIEKIHTIKIETTSLSYKDLFFAKE